MIHPSFFVIHPSFRTIHPSFFVIHPSFRMIHPSFFVIHPSFRMIHPFLHFLPLFTKKRPAQVSCPPQKSTFFMTLFQHTKHFLEWQLLLAQ
jgi:hypothetical protein